jgi:hypothetical protein
MFGFLTRLAASQASIMRDSADWAVSGMVGGRYCFEKGGGRCMVKIGISVWFGNSPWRTHNGTVWVGRKAQILENVENIDI